MAGNNDKVYDNNPQHYAKDNSRAHLTARSDKSVAYVTNNKKTTQRFVLLKLTTDRHKISRGLFVTAELLVTYRSLRNHVQKYYVFAPYAHCVATPLD